MAAFPTLRAAHFLTPGNVRGLTSDKGDLLVGTSSGGLQRVAAGSTGQTLMFNSSSESGVEVTGAPSFSGTVSANGFTAGDIDFGTTAADTITGASGITLATSGNITINAAAPTSTDHVATKGYVDSVASGLSVKMAVRAKTADLLPSYTASGNTLTGSSNGALSIDGVSVSAGNRVLVDQVGTGTGAASAMCGIYDVVSAGSTGSVYVLTRSDDANTSSEVKAGMFTFVTEGATAADKGYVLTTNDTITLNTTQLSFSVFSSSGDGGAAGSTGQIQFNNAGSLGASSGLTFSSGILSVDTIGPSSGLNNVSFKGGVSSDPDARLVIGQMSAQTQVGNSVSIGNTLAADCSVSIGHGTTASEIGAVSLGYLTTASGERSVSLGAEASAVGFGSVSLGSNAYSVSQATAFGYTAVASGTSSTAVGGNSTASAENSVGIGPLATAAGTSSLAAGFNAAATGNYSLAFGVNARSALVGCCNISTYHILRRTTGGAASFTNATAVSLLSTDSFVLSASVPSSAGIIQIPTGAIFFLVGVRVWCSQFTSVHATESAFTASFGVGTTYLGSNVAVVTSVPPASVGSSQLQLPCTYQDGLTGSIYIANLTQFPLSVFQYRLGLYGHLVELD